MCRAELGCSWVLAALLLAAAAPGCTQEMRDQAKIEPLEAAAFFDDGPGARPEPVGTIPRGATLDPHLAQGRVGGAFATTFPFPITDADLTRGEAQFGIYCVPCHGRLALGDGMAVRRGYPAPPPLTLARPREAPVGELFDVISHGRANMPDYEMITLPDRWRIVAWVRVLQLSQHADPGRLAPDDLAHLAAAAAPSAPAPGGGGEP